MKRNRAFRRHQANRHMWRRLSEDRNQHYKDLDCACWTDPKAMARFREQPKLTQCQCCCNVRRSLVQYASAYERLTLQERRNLDFFKQSLY